MNISVIEARLSDGASGPEAAQACGYGRDADEARSNGGFFDDEQQIELSEIELHDSPDRGDDVSESAANAVFRYHIEEDGEIPAFVKEELQRLMSKRLYASAVRYCFEMVWDRGFQSEQDEDAQPE